MSAQTAESHSNVTAIVVGALAMWLALVFVLGWEGTFVRPPGSPPLPILFGVAAPLLVFLAAYLAVPSFRDFMLTVDLRLVTGIQAWRFAGLGFLALYTYGVLPGVFAIPAGLADIAIGITAPWIMLALLRSSAFAGSRIFKAWNVLGIVDLVVAVGTGALVSALSTGAAGEMTTAPMALLPLVLIPAFLVPISTMLHLIALFQARGLNASERQRDHPLLSPEQRRTPGTLDPRKAHHGDHVEPYDRTGS
jgi:hypothetical protein